MSFDYAMRASDAALQMQQGMSQNIRDSNSKVADVGKRNATSKDQLVRQKIQAEYDMSSANIKAWKAGKLHQLAEERQKFASAAAALVGIGHLAGGMIDGIKDLSEHFKNDGAKVPQAPESEQMTVGADAVANGQVSAFKIASGDGPSEQGAVVAFDAKKGNFSAFRMNTTTGAVDKFQNMNMSEMATLIRDRTKDSADPKDKALAGMIQDGPPVMFKPEFLEKKEDGHYELGGELQAALFGATEKTGHPEYGQGFFAKDNGEAAIGGVLERGAAISPGYQATSRSVMEVLGTEKVQGALGINSETVGKTQAGMEKSGLLTGGFMSGAGAVFSKAIFKPLSTSLGPFMAMAKVAKEYEEEAKAKKVEYESAKQQAAAAMKRLKQIEAELAAGY
ncbi:hypothetical protein COW64_01415 [bacterium (Candidatus Blackallbacteria) CG18_big_fil_WC_8_21_14_2_50_49_26]|nr:MAG: hypothetical protein COW64_01415 [bacterium (Candidatus Blackallbacteria) CG18_big_fil_WC_8_21_14_2_50_49_26]